jgi:hypothetical protein
MKVIFAATRGVKKEPWDRVKSDSQSMLFIPSFCVAKMNSTARII